MARSRTEVGHLFRLLYLAIGGLVLVSLLGTAGFDLLTDGRYPLFDSFYMTFVTISTIGFGEIIDMSNNMPARVLTVTVAIFGTGMLSMAFSIVTVIVLESDINGTLKRKRMEKAIKKLKDHYILCGLSRVGRNVAHELIATERQFVAIDANLQVLDDFREREPGLLYLHGDGSDDDILRRADLLDAAGLFAVTGDDSMNLMIVITAKQLRPHMRVVARCHEVRNIEKMKKAGADAIVSPDFTGGLRIASACCAPMWPRSWTKCSKPTATSGSKRPWYPRDSMHVRWAISACGDRAACQLRCVCRAVRGNSIRRRMPSSNRAVC